MEGEMVSKNSEHLKDFKEGRIDEDQLLYEIAENMPKSEGRIWKERGEALREKAKNN